MCAQRIWPTVQVIGRGLVSNRNEIIQQGFRAYNVQNFNNGHASTNIHSQNYGDDRRLVSQYVSRTSRGLFLKVVSQNYSQSSVLYCREFCDSENEYAHSVLRSLPAYHSTTVDSDYNTTKSHLQPSNSCPQNSWYRNWETASTNETIDTFIDMTNHLSENEFEDAKCSDLCQVLVKRIPSISDESIMRLLSALTQWPPSMTSASNNYIIIWNALDKACLTRVAKWSFEKGFLVADHWYALKLSKISLYMCEFLRKLSYELKSLNPSQFVQYMFYINLYRALSTWSFYDFEKKMFEVLKFVSIEEIGVIAMGLFKSETVVKNEKIVNLMVNRIVNDIDTISEHTLGALLKLLRTSFSSVAHSQCYDLLSAMYPKLNCFNNLVLLQIALLGNNLLVFHPETIAKIGEKFMSELQNLRLKDIERFTYVLMLYQFTPLKCPEIYEKIIEELRRPERLVEISHFPKCFVSCVNYLAATERFPMDLISAALQPSMLELLKSSNIYETMGRELNELNWVIRIEVPSYYPGYMLDNYLSLYLTKKYLGRIPHKEHKNLTHQDNLSLDVQDKMSAILGSSDCTLLSCVLPHFSTPDLVFCTTSYGEPIAIPDEYKLLPAEALKCAFGAGYGMHWNAIIIGGRNSFIRNTTTLKGSLQMKKRQLSKIGYNVTVLCHSNYVKQKMPKKLSYLEEILMQTSTLNMDGRRNMAFDTLKSQIAVNNANESITSCKATNL